MTVTAIISQRAGSRTVQFAIPRRTALPSLAGLFAPEAGRILWPENSFSADVARQYSRGRFGGPVGGLADQPNFCLGSGRLGSSQLGEALDQPLTFEPRQAVDPEHAVRLVELMLQARRPEAVCLLLAHRPGQVLVAAGRSTCSVTPDIETPPSLCTARSGEVHLKPGPSPSIRE